LFGPVVVRLEAVDTNATSSSRPVSWAASAAAALARRPGFAPPTVVPRSRDSRAA